MSIVLAACAGCAGVRARVGDGRPPATRTATTNRAEAFARRVAESDPTWVTRDDDGNITELVLSADVAPTDEELSALAALPRLEALILSGYANEFLTDRALKHLGGCASLRKLGMRCDPRIGDETVARVCVAVPQLEELDLTLAGITDGAMRYVAKLGRLRSLKAGSTAITDAGVGHVRGLDQLVLLDVSFTKVGDAAMEHLSGAPRLRELRAAHTKVTDKGLELLGRPLSLRTLVLSGCRVSAAAVAKLTAANPGLRVWR